MNKTILARDVRINNYKKAGSIRTNCSSQLVRRQKYRVKESSINFQGEDREMGLNKISMI